MSRCATCDTALEEGQSSCAKCGAPAGLASPAAPPSGGAPAAARRRRSFRLDDLFRGTDHVVVGRSPECGIVLPHPRVSLYHALLIRAPYGLEIVDLDSAAGVTADGRRVRQRAVVVGGQRFGVGPFLFTLAGPDLHCLDSSESLRLEARGVEKEIALAKGGRRKLLGGIDLVVEPGEFVCLLGPSGSGKSTLMDCLNGRRRATGGRVLANGEDFYENFDQFRQSLGYVPQRDIVHRGLTVARALHYTAQLRLPRDTAEAELEARVEEVLRQMELGPHRQTTVGQLSGGQVKRVSLGAELLARPSLLFVDEATSGLDAGTEARMMRLFRRLADDGKSVVCITHNVENVDQCHLVLVLAAGRLIYYGPPADAPGYFGVQRVGQVYDRLAERDPKEWEAQFRDSPLHKEFVGHRLAAPAGGEPEAGGTPAGPADSPVVVSSAGDAAPAVAGNGQAAVASAAATDPSAAERLAAGLAAGRAATLALRSRAGRGLTSLRTNWFQFLILTRRYAELLVRDRKSLRLLLMQAPIVGMILAIGLTHIDYMTQLPWNKRLEPGQKHVLQSLHDFNWVVSAVEDGTVEEDDTKARLQQITFTVINADPKVDPAVRKQRMNGYEMARRVQRNLKGLPPGWFMTGPTTAPTTAPAAAGGGPGGPDTRPAPRSNWLSRLNFRTSDNLRLVVGETDGPAAGATATGDRQAGIELQQVVAMVHTLAKLDTRHPDKRKDLPGILLDLDKNQVTPVVPNQERPFYVVPQKAWAVMFILAIAVFWFGCNNAVKEIVKEQAVYARERAVGLRILPYLGSKFLIQGIVAVFQVFVLLGVVHGIFRATGVTMPTMPGSAQCMYFLPYGQQFGVLALLSVTAVACGLLISAGVSSLDRANTLAPYVLIPQIILAGSFIPIEGPFLKTLAGSASPVYWAFRVLQHGWGELPDYMPNYHADFGLGRTCVALGVQTIVLLAAAAVFLRRKDTGRG